MSDATDDHLFEHAPCGYAVLDAGGLVLSANAELLRILGRTRDDVVGQRTLPSLVTIGGRIFFDTHLFPLLELEQVVHEVALDVVAADGTRVPVLIAANLAPGATREGTRIRMMVMEAQDRRRYETDLLRMVREVEESRRAAVELAEALQQTLIPPSPPVIDGLQISAAYRPAGDGSEVGGDFYDVFQLDDDSWMLVIGDVVGKGVAAATVTSFVRHTVRALAMQFREPAELLGWLDRAVAESSTDRFCTLVVARLTRRGEEWTVTGSIGGHPLPLLRCPDGRVVTLGIPGSLVGVVDDPVFTTFEHTLGEGLLLLHTDGVTEARFGGQQYGDQRLARLVSDTPPDVHALTAAIISDVLAFQSEHAHDDIAVLAVQRAARP